MVYDATQRAQEAWEHFDKLLDQRLDEIADKAGVDRAQLIKINPAEFIEKNKHQRIDGYFFAGKEGIAKYIDNNKTDDTYLISPLDAIEETAAQIAYKSRNNVERKIRASKCEVYPIPKETALDFFIRNHRQGPPNIRETAVYLGLVYKNELVAVMGYDIQNGAVRGSNKDYELVRLAIAKGAQIYGGASKLQAACEDVLRTMGVKQIYSYSNATINNGGVYKQLGFTSKKVDSGQPFVITKTNKLVRLIELFPYSTDEHLARKGELKTHIGGNRFWIKDITKTDAESE